MAGASSCDDDALGPGGGSDCGRRGAARGGAGRRRRHLAGRQGGRWPLPGRALPGERRSRGASERPAAGPGRELGG